MAIIASQSAVRDSTRGPKLAPPALVIRISSWPKRSRVRATSRSTCASSATSVGTTRATPPFVVMSWATTSRVCAVRAAKATRTPAWASARAVARPMPDPAPVIIAAWPCRFWPVMLLAVVLEKVLGRFPQTNPGQARAEPGLEQIPDHFDDIFAGGVEGAELRGVFIQMLVIEAFNHCVLDRLHQDAEVHDHAGTRIDCTPHRDLQLVIMAVAVEVVALAEHCAVFFC